MNARLKLVAGDVNRIIEQRGAADAVRALAEVSAKATPAPFSEESFFDYHLYSLQRPTTIKDQQTKQVALLSSDKLPVTKRYFITVRSNTCDSDMAFPFKTKKSAPT